MQTQISYIFRPLCLEYGRMHRARLVSLLPALIAVGTLLIAVMFWTARSTPSPSETGQPAPASVPAIKIQTGHHQPLVATQGRVRARHVIDVVSRVGGEIKSVTPLYNTGAQFKQGDLLLSLDKTDYLSALAQARSRLAVAEQTLAQEQARAEEARRRWQDLGSEAANALFLREPQLAAARSEVEAAQAAVEKSKQDLAYTEVHAPFDGEVENVMADFGQYVPPGTPLATVYSSNELEVRLSLNAEQLRSLGWLDHAEHVPENRLQARIRWSDAKEGETVEQVGHIRNIGAQMDASTQLYPVFINIGVSDNNDTLPNPGRFVEVELRAEPRANTVWVPDTALYERSQVLLIQEDQLVPRQVDVLAQTENEVLVGGLSDGDIVVRQRPLWVLPGQRVSPLFDESL